jgi:hypothetical protein
MLFTNAHACELPQRYLDRRRQAGIAVVMVSGHEPAEFAAHGAHCNDLFRAHVDDALRGARASCCGLARVGRGYDAIGSDQPSGAAGLELPAHDVVDKSGHGTGRFARPRLIRGQAARDSYAGHVAPGARP